MSHVKSSFKVEVQRKEFDVPVTRAEFDRLGYTERAQLSEEHPDIYKRFTEPKKGGV